MPKGPQDKKLKGKGALIRKGKKSATPGWEVPDFQTFSEEQLTAPDAVDACKCL